jgi:hypothetical protein
MAGFGLFVGIRLQKTDFWENSGLKNVQLFSNLIFSTLKEVNFKEHPKKNNLAQVLKILIKKYLHYSFFFEKNVFGLDDFWVTLRAIFSSKMTSYT